MRRWARQAALVADLSPENKHYLGLNEWCDPAQVDRGSLSYDIMMVRGCPFECTFCIHNYTRKVTSGLGTYIRRRSVDHVMRELRAIIDGSPGAVWLVAPDSLVASRTTLTEDLATFIEGLDAQIVYTGLDGDMRVYRLEGHGR